MRISHTAIIRRAPAAVFSWIADPARAARWQPDVVDYEITAEAPNVVGTAFRERLGDEAGSIDMRGRVVAYDPGRQIAFDLRGRGIQVTSRYSVRPYGNATELIVELAVRVLGPLTGLLEPFLRPRFERQVTGDVERLRVMCESEDDPAGRHDGSDARVAIPKLAARPV
ncbi:MAG TPA: SRPBCC family protein [Candidatus Limnocylindrales bacterium]|nr:SRPBCC family protein [Candidatus Limnocylindrales bacterium]